MGNIANLVQEASTTVGSGSTILLSALAGFARFSDRFAVGDQVNYCIEDGANWEIGVGTVGVGNSFIRSTVQETFVTGQLNLSTSPISLSGAALVRVVASTQYLDSYLAQKLDAAAASLLFLTKTGNLSEVVDKAAARTNLGVSASGAVLQVANNLSDVNNVGTARTNLGLGTAGAVSFASLLLGDGSQATPAIAWSSQTAFGLWRSATDTLTLSSNTGTTAKLKLLGSDGRNGAIQTGPGGGLDMVGSGNTFILRILANGGQSQARLSALSANAATSYWQLWDENAADILALRNGANAQTFRAYNTYTDASNYERLSLSFTPNVRLVHEAAGTGSGARTFSIGVNGNGVVALLTNNTARWNVLTGGDLEPGATNTYTAGTSSILIKRVYATDYFMRSGSADPTTTDIPATGNVLWKNTTSGDISLWVNDGGTMKRGVLMGVSDSTKFHRGDNTWSNALTGLLDLSGAAAGQIQFPATANLSANANTLDAYAEGTFTPVLDFGGATTGITYSVQNGKYRRIGAWVHIEVRVTLTNKGSATGAAHITGLPFAGAGLAGLNVGVCNNLGTLAAPPMFEVQSTTVFMFFMSSGTATTLTDTSFSNTTELIFSGGYVI